MGGHKWVPQNRGLNVCTSGYGCTSCAVFYRYDLDPFSYERYEADSEAEHAARVEALRVAAQAVEAEAAAAVLRDTAGAAFPRIFFEVVEKPHQEPLFERIELSERARVRILSFNSSSSSTDDETLRASPVSLLLWLPSLFATFFALARCTIFALLVLLAFLPSAKAMEMPPFGAPPSPSGGGGANTAFAAGAVAVAALGYARLHGARTRLGAKGFQRKVPTAVPAPLAPSSPAAPPPPIKKGRSTSPARAAAAAPQATNSLWGAFFGGKAAAPPPSPASRFALPAAVYVPRAPSRAPFLPYVNARHNLKRPLGSPLSSPAPQPRVYASPRLPSPKSSPAGPAARSPSMPRSLAVGSPLRAIRQQLSFADPSAPTAAAPTPARALPSAAALLCGAPLTVTTPSGTATLTLSREHGLVWGESSVTGEAGGSPLLDFLAPFNGEAPQRVLKSGALVKELAVLSNPARSVCLVVEGAVCSIVVMKHSPPRFAPEVPAADATFTMRVCRNLRSHWERGRMVAAKGLPKQRAFEVLHGSSVINLLVGDDALYSSVGKGGVVERAALVALGEAAGAHSTSRPVVLATVGAQLPLPHFGMQPRDRKPGVSVPSSTQAGVIGALLGVSGLPSVALASPTTSGHLSASAAAEAVINSIAIAAAGGDTVVTTAPVPGAVLASGKPPAAGGSGDGAKAHVTRAARVSEVLAAVERELELEDAARLVERYRNLPSGDEARRCAANFVSSPVAVQFPPAAALRAGCTHHSTSCDPDSATIFTPARQLDDFPILRHVINHYPLSPDVHAGIAHFNADTSDALKQPIAAREVEELLKDSGASTLSAAREVFTARGTVVGGTQARQCAALCAVLDGRAVAWVLALQGFAKEVFPEAAAAASGVSVRTTLSNDHFASKAAMPTVCKDMGLDPNSGAYACLSNPASATGLPIYLQLHVARTELNCALEDVMRAAMFVRAGFDNAKLRASLFTMGDKPLEVPGGFLLHLAAAALLIERGQLGVSAAEGVITLCAKTFNMKVYDGAAALPSGAVADIVDSLGAAGPRLASVVQQTSSPLALLLTIFSGPLTRTAVGVGVQFAARGADELPLLWNIPAAEVRSKEGARQLVLGSDAAALSMGNMFEPFEATAAGASTPFKPLPLQLLSVFSVGGLPPPLRTFVSLHSLPTAAAEAGASTELHAVGRQMYYASWRQISKHLEAAVDFAHWVTPPISGAASFFNLRALLESCHRGVTELNTSLAHGITAGPVSRVEYTFLLPYVDIAGDSAEGLKGRVAGWLGGFFSKALKRVGRDIVQHAYGTPSSVALGYVGVQATGLHALQVATVAAIKAAHTASDVPRVCALYYYLRQLNGCLRYLLKGTHAASMYPALSLALGRPAAAPFPPKCLGLHGAAAGHLVIQPTTGPATGADVTEIDYGLIPQLLSTANNAVVNSPTCASCHLTFACVDDLFQHLAKHPAHKQAPLEKPKPVKKIVGEIRDTLFPSQRQAFDDAMSGYNTLIIGPAGRGKSHLLAAIIKACCVCAQAVAVPDDATPMAPGRIQLKPVSAALTAFNGDPATSWTHTFLKVTSSTNATAANLGDYASTFHALVGQSLFHKDRTAQEVKRLLLDNTIGRRRLKDVRALIVDEFGRLVVADVLGLSLALSEIHSNPAPFGGIQLLFLGDVMQGKDYDGTPCCLHAQFLEWFARVVYLREPARTKCKRLLDAQDVVRGGGMVDLTAFGGNVAKPTSFKTQFPGKLVPEGLAGEIPDFKLLDAKTVVLAPTNARVKMINLLGVEQMIAGDESLKRVALVAYDIFRNDGKGGYTGVDKRCVASSHYDKLFTNLPSGCTLCVGAPGILTSRATLVSGGGYIKKGARVTVVAFRLKGNCHGDWPAGVKPVPDDANIILVRLQTADADAPAVYATVSVSESEHLDGDSHQPTHRSGFHILPAFCITIFRSQGLEWLRLLIDGFGWFKSHGMLYLAMTRAKGAFEDVRFINVENISNFVDPSLADFDAACLARHDCFRILSEAQATDTAVFVAPPGSLFNALSASLDAAPPFKFDGPVADDVMFAGMVL